MKEEILDELKEYNISTTVRNYTKEVLEYLEDYLQGGIVYVNPHGTVSIDWEDVFSLEIGKDSIGYFIEEDGVDTKQVDSVPFEEIKEELVGDLKSFLNIS